METVQEVIRNWLLEQQDWLQEAADRLLKQGNLLASDLQVICSLLKTPEGRSVTKHRVFDSLVAANDHDTELRLHQISGVSGIENLSPNVPLNFGEGNLTILYGHNGSGKSSYTRILKIISGKPSATPLKANVFNATPLAKHCQVSFSMNGELSTIDWLVNGAPIENLRAIDIFDSEVAIGYLTEESAASYIPPLVKLFESLATVCDQIKDLLQKEQNQLTRKLPNLPPNFLRTGPGKQYQSLHAHISDDALKLLLTWSEEHQSRLESIKERLKSADPKALAKRKRDTKARIEKIIQDLKLGLSAYKTANIEDIRARRTIANEKRKIADEAAKVGSAQLDGVGSVTWHAMWEAARTYSKTAYPTGAFPQTDDGAKCVLCQQNLSADAQTRLQEFEKFVQGELESAAKKAEGLYQDALNRLPKAPSQEEIETLCIAADLTSDRWNKYLQEFWATASLAKKHLIDHEKQGLATEVADATDAIAMLEKYGQQLQGEAEQCEKDAQEFDREKAEEQLLALEAKRWIAHQEAAVTSEIARLREVETYDSWKGLVNPGRISRKAGDVAEQFVTKAYEMRFNDELKKMGASHIRVQLIKSRTSRGISLHRLCLKGATNNKALPHEVLSEGERRIISLAAFLADVVNKPQSSTFVFDDPISSLDHEYEWHVAKRLAELAKERQVIVFTHRLSLFGAMEDVAKKMGDEWKKQHFQQMCIEAYFGAAGHPAEQATWNAKTKKADNILLGRLNAAKKAESAEMYRQLAQGICSDFRKLLERTVEDDLLNEVVKRHRRSVTTDGRLTKLPKIQQEDCQLIDRLMTKYSCFEHSQSQEAPILIPEEAELRSDIEELKTWRAEFSKR